MNEETNLRDRIAQRAFEAWMSDHAPGTDPLDYGPFPRTQGTGRSVWVCAAEAMLDHLNGVTRGPLLRALRDAYDGIGPDVDLRHNQAADAVLEVFKVGGAQ